MRAGISVLIALIILAKLNTIHAQENILQKTIPIRDFTGTQKEFLKYLETRAGVGFSYTNKILLDKEVHFEKSEKSIKEYLDILFPGGHVTYHIEGSKILLLQNLDNHNGRIKQNIRGVVTDKDSKSPLTGATVILSNSAPLVGTITNVDGEFVLADVPVGRCAVEARFVGYKTNSIHNLILKSAKELFITIELEENVEEMEEVIVTAYDTKWGAMNKMASVGARAFSAEQTERYAGSWGDPSRMATNYAGVFMAGDQVNDIVIRGNSPTGLLWSFEGVPIPSPNHFDVMGATGGPVSMLNNNLLARSDFFTGAFPAEFGNAISGVFDLKMRNGNNKKREYVAQIGFNGFELGAEGPFSSKGKASYLINYRYSMLGLVDELLWVEGLPYYQDVSFKLHFPTDKGSFSVFGLGGISHINFTFEDSITPEDPVKKGSYETDGSKTGVAGMRWIHFFSDDFRMTNCIALATRRPYYFEDSTFNGKITGRMADMFFDQNTLSYSMRFIKKFNAKNTLDFGGQLQRLSLQSKNHLYHYETKDSVIHYDPYQYDEKNLFLMQNYIQLKHRFTNTVSLVGGLHYMQFFLNNTMVLEPRLGMTWQFHPKQKISAGYGLHSQMQPLNIYFMPTRDETLPDKPVISNSTNKNLEFTKSHQYVIGYDYIFTPNLRLKIETYYQDLFNVPVENSPSYYSTINDRDFYGDEEIDSLVNKGTGKNYGIELTFEKFLSNNYYFLLTTSLFNSTYKGSDGIERNTTYNGRYVVNFLGGYEWKLNNFWSLNFDLRSVWAGGRRIVPVDFIQSIEKEMLEYEYDKAYEQQVNDYFRLDVRIGCIYQGKKTTHEFAFDVTNITNHMNEYGRNYNADNTENTIEISYQQGIFPMGLYRINF